MWLAIPGLRFVHSRRALRQTQTSIEFRSGKNYTHWTFNLFEVSAASMTYILARRLQLKVGVKLEEELCILDVLR